MNCSIVSCNRKVAIIGAGFVGSSIAYAMTLKDVAREIVLIDIDAGRAEGEAMDIRQGISGMGTADLYTGTYEDCADCDLIVITAGRNRKPGESRLDLATENTQILRDVLTQVKKYYTRGVVLIVSNPVDILTHKASEWMDLPNGMVFGAGCILDTSRFVRAVADYTGMSPDVISGYLAGEHGDEQIPVWSSVKVAGVPIKDFCSEANLVWDAQKQNEIALRIKNMGAEIIRRKGKTHYGIASCVCHLADAILNHKQTTVSVSSPLQGEYGINGVSLSVLSIVGPSGVQQRICDNWSAEEHHQFCAAAEKAKTILRKIDC